LGARPRILCPHKRNGEASCRATERDVPSLNLFRACNTRRISEEQPLPALAIDHERRQHSRRPSSTGRRTPSTDERHDSFFSARPCFPIPRSGEYIPTLGPCRSIGTCAQLHEPQSVAERTFGRVETSTTVGGRGVVARLRCGQVATRILILGLDAADAFLLREGIDAGTPPAFARLSANAEELTDLGPTVLDFLGITAPAGLDGRSLLRGSPVA
jgi:hypothetical protein